MTPGSRARDRVRTGMCFLGGMTMPMLPPCSRSVPLLLILCVVAAGCARATAPRGVADGEAPSLASAHDPDWSVSTSSSAVAATQVRGYLADLESKDPALRRRGFAGLDEVVHTPATWAPARAELEADELQRAASGVAPFLTSDDPIVREAALRTARKLDEVDEQPVPSAVARGARDYADRLMEGRGLSGYERENRAMQLASTLDLLRDSASDPATRALAARVQEDAELHRLVQDKQVLGWASAESALAQARRLASGG